MIMFAMKHKFAPFYLLISQQTREIFWRERESERERKILRERNKMENEN